MYTENTDMAKAVNLFVALGWKYLETIPYYNEEGDAIGERTFLEKANQEIMIDQSFFTPTLDYK